jgi:hypothetical protein
VLTASNTEKTGTSVNVTDRIQFFNNVKITGMKAITRSMELLTGAVSDNNVRIALTHDGTSIATAALGTVAGAVNSGGVVAALANVAAGTGLDLVFKATGDGTAGTFGQVSADVYIEYQERFS